MWLIFDQINLYILKRFFLLIFFALRACFVFAQPAKQYSFTHFSTTNGLVTNITNNVVQDHQGFIWLATIDGLQRYDGNKFLTFRKRTSGPSSLPEDYIARVYVDRLGNLWIWCTNKVGIFNTSNFTFIDVPIEGEDKKHPFNITLAAPDDKDNMMVYIDGKGLYKYDDAKKMFRVIGSFQLPKTWNISDLRAIPNEGKYLFGSFQSVAVFNTKTGNVNYRGHNPDNDPYIQQLQKDSAITTFFDLQNDKLLYGSWPLVSGAPFATFLDVKTGATKKYSIGSETGLGYVELYGALKQKNNHLWFYGRTFIAKYTGNEKKPFELINTEFHDEQSITFDRANNMYEDRQNNIWISTDNGVFVFRPDGQSFDNCNLSRPDNPKGIPGPTMAPCELKNGNVFVGSWGRGLYYYDKNFNALSLPPGLEKYNAGYSIWSIHEHTQTGLIWMGMQGGEVTVYDPVKTVAEKFTNQFFDHSTVRSITEDHQGNLWFGMQSGNVVKWDVKAANKDFHKGYILVKEKDHAFIQKMFTDKDGFVWEASVAYGLFKFDPVTNKVLEHITEDGPADQSLWANNPYDILQYNDSLLLIANGSLDILNIKTKKIKHITTDDGLPSNTVLAVESDDRGGLWLGMAHGLCRLNLEKRIFSTYDRRDGMGYDLFNPACGYIMQDGRLIFTTDKNFIVFDPDSVHETPVPSDAVVTGFKLSNKSLLVDSIMALNKIHLPYDNTSILIEFSALNYVRQNKIHYIYKLDGIDKGWQETTDLNQAVYNYLPAGDYTFEVRAENSDGVLSKNVTTFHISVAPPFWKTWWFLGILALLVIALFYIVDRERIKRMQALQKVRTQIAQNLHHDVNTTLNNISLLSEMAKIKVDKDVERSKQYIDQISDKSRKMIDAMDDMLWSLNPENDNMQKTILRMKEYAEGLQSSIQMEVDEKVKSLRLDMKARHEIFLIFKEAMHAIAKQANGSLSVINIDLSGAKLLLKIQNSELLFKSTPETRQIKQEMLQRANLINAELDIQSDSKGVSIILLLPVH